MAAATEAERALAMAQQQGGERESLAKIVGLANGILTGWGVAASIALAEVVLGRIAEAKLPGDAPPDIQRYVKLARVALDAMREHAGSDVILAPRGARVNGRRIA